MKEQEPKDVEWIKGTITTTCKAWADRERFAVFYKGDFISFYNKCLEQGKAQMKEEMEKVQTIAFHNGVEQGKAQVISEFKEKTEEIFDFLEDNGYLTFWIRNGRDGKDELRAELNKTAQEITG